jgi:hypothetical protein
MRSPWLRPALGLVVSLVTALVPAVARAADPTPADVVAGLHLPVGDTVADAVAQPLRSLGALRPSSGGLRIALISSGVAAGVLPEQLRDQVTHLGNAADGIGYGTYAASVLFQLDPDALVTSIGVYPGGRFDPGAQANALAWVIAHAKDVDAVLYAVPPHEFLDPVSASMAAGEWDAVTAELTRPAKAPRTPSDRQALGHFHGLQSRWAGAAGQVRTLNAAGVAVVAPAGDLGPKLQTILGFGNMPEVVTVGGFDGRGVSAQSSSGPSADGGVKPDLVAPTGIVGLLPAKSSLSKALGKDGLLDKTLEPAWNAGDPVTEARARLDSSFTSAAVVAAAMAGMSRGGLRDVAKQRGALTAASVPLAGVPVWRQGAGVMRIVPDAAFASSRPLALGHLSMGAEPDAGTWSTTVPFTQGAPTSAKTSLGAFAGVGPDAKSYTRSVKSSDSPPVSAGVSNDGVSITVPLGEDRYDGGLYCGYTDVSIPGTSGTARPGVSVNGIPSGTEQIPTCLVEGSRLQAFGFYIHDIPAPDLTFGLLPALPEEASILEKPLMLLPVNPLHTKLYFKPTGADGNAYFPNIPPGYYTIRLFADYGNPIEQTVTDSSTGAPLVRRSDIGENPSYLSFPALVLSATHWTEQDLKDRFGAGNVEQEKATKAYIVTIGPKKLRIVLGYVKDKQGVAVASRYIDLLRYDDLDFSALPLDTALKINQLKKAGVTTGLNSWTFSRGAGADKITGLFNPALALGGPQEVLGIATYPFGLTTPNYKAHMSLNFAYEVDNAFVIALVRIGREAAFGVVTPRGTLRSPTVGTEQPIGTNGLGVSGTSTGLANFEFEFKPHGASTGTITFIFVPSRPVQAVASPLTSASIDDVSFELDTWQRVQWPNLMTPFGMGHLFDINPHFSSRQITGACRPVDSGGIKADVCEDWRVLFQSPLDDSRLMDIDSSGSTVGDIRTSASQYADPDRGVSDFSSSIGVSEGLLALGLPMELRTNGVFWEQMGLSRDVLAKHPGGAEVQIVDNAEGRTSDIRPHVAGAVPVAPYVPFASDAVVLGGNELSLTDRDGDGVPLLSVAVRAPDVLAAAGEVLRIGDPDDRDASVPGDGGGLVIGAALPDGTFAAFCKLPASQPAVSAVVPIKELDHGSHNASVPASPATQTSTAQQPAAKQSSNATPKPQQPSAPKVKVPPVRVGKR